MDLEEKRLDDSLVGFLIARFLLQAVTEAPKQSQIAPL
jgi:hypothetical protein